MNGFFSSDRIQKESPRNAIVPKCGQCGLYKGCHSPKIEPRGEGRKKVLIVGEAPSKAEDEQGRFNVGPSGDYLRGVLGGLGIKMDRDVMVTNSLICHTKGTPESKQISYCRANLLNTIKEFEPKVIITMGRSALASIMYGYWKSDLGPLERWTGWQIPMDRFWVCPTYHPSFLIWSHQTILDRMFSEHLEAAFAIEDTPESLENFEKQIEVVFDEKVVWNALREMDSQGGRVAIDIETNCLKPNYEKAQIYSCAVSNGDRTISYLWRGKAIEATRKFLLSKRTQKIASNIKMEERWFLWEFGRGVRRWGWDTMLAAHCLDYRPGICSLKFQSLIHFGVPSYNERIQPFLEGSIGSFKRLNRIYEAEPDALLFYGGMDAILEYRLAMKQRKEMGFED